MSWLVFVIGLALFLSGVVCFARWVALQTLLLLLDALSATLKLIGSLCGFQESSQTRAS